MEFSGSFLDLIGNKQSVGLVTLAIESAIAASFALDGGTMTASEVKRRFNMCQDIFKVLRGDMQWGIERIVDHLPQYLRAELSGATWEPDKRQCWIPGDGG